jgi:hypothetical protein
MAKAYKPLPAAEELWELFDYKPLTGELVWRIKAGRRVHVGDVAGCLKPRGYYEICWKQRNYTNHRVVWKWVTGADPGAMHIDHINRIKHDNRHWNLRLATGTQNRHNRAAKGYIKTGNHWYARIRVDLKWVPLGSYATPEEAHAAYKKAAAELYGEFAVV